MLHDHLYYIVYLKCNLLEVFQYFFPILLHAWWKCRLFSFLNFSCLSVIKGEYQWLILISDTCSVCFKVQSSLASQQLAEKFPLSRKKRENGPISMQGTVTAPEVWSEDRLLFQSAECRTRLFKGSCTGYPPSRHKHTHTHTPVSDVWNMESHQGQSVFY